MNFTKITIILKNKNNFTKIGPCVKKPGQTPD